MILNEDAVRDLLHIEDLIPAMAGALADLSSGKVVQRGRPCRLLRLNAGTRIELQMIAVKP